MKSYKDHLKEHLTDPEFKSLYEDEKQLLELGLKIAEKRRQLGISQKELAPKSHVTRGCSKTSVLEQQP
jgi:hypothetical protein